MSLKDHARQMRRSPTPAEQALWHLLRDRRFADTKFVRQHIVGPYILDFAARREKLAIEVDGDTHAGQTRYDAARTAFLEDMGYRVIRFTNAEVMGNIEGVAFAISTALGASAVLPSPNQHQVGHAPGMALTVRGTVNLMLPGGERA